VLGRRRAGWLNIGSDDDVVLDHVDAYADLISAGLAAVESDFDWAVSLTSTPSGNALFKPTLPMAIS
jgi:hypothetical protein